MKIRISEDFNKVVLVNIYENYLLTRTLLPKPSESENTAALPPLPNRGK